MTNIPQNLINELLAAEAKSTQGEWSVRTHPTNEEAFFVERPRVKGEAYGVDILGDDFYPTKRGDADFIVAAKKLAMALRAGKAPQS